MIRGCITPSGWCSSSSSSLNVGGKIVVLESDNLPKLEQYILCLSCGGRGYRVKWTNGRGRTTNCKRCRGSGSELATDWGAARG